MLARHLCIELNNSPDAEVQAIGLNGTVEPVISVDKFGKSLIICADEKITLKGIMQAIDRLRHIVDKHEREMENAGENEHALDWFGRAFGYLVMAHDAVRDAISEQRKTSHE